MADPAFAVPDQVGRLLTGLFGKPVAVKKGAALPPGSKVVIGEYRRDDGSLGALCVCDIAAASSAGAALALIPPGAAQDSIKAAKIPENIAENLQEVLNIMSRLFQNGTTPRVVFKAVTLPPSGGSSDAALLMKKPAIRADFDVVIPNYPPGKITMMVAP